MEDVGQCQGDLQAGVNLLGYVRGKDGVQIPLRPTLRDIQRRRKTERSPPRSTPLVADLLHTVAALRQPH